jgi:transposase-like protein
MVLEHQDEHDSQWAAIVSIAEKIGCSAETLRNWVRQAERDQGRRPGLTTAAWQLTRGPAPEKPDHFELEDVTDLRSATETGGSR